MKKMIIRKHKRSLFCKRILTCSLTIAMAVTMIPIQPVIAKTQEKQENEDTEEKVMETIEISTAEDLENLAGKCHIDSWSTDKIIKMTADIDLAGSNFVNIPVFRGVFDGNGHTISNYRYSGDGYVAGFFRYIEEGGIVENVSLIGNVSSDEEKQCIGALCGVNKGTIRNCTFQGLVSGKYETGGIAGVNEGTGAIQRCSVKGTITGYYYTGGIAGKNFGSIDNCSNYANINNNMEWVEQDDEISVDILQNIRNNETEVKVASGVDTGGIAGFSKGVIMRCTNSGNIGYEHTGYNIGGIAGRQSGVVAMCTNHGSVYGRKDIGGIVGQMEPYIEINEAESIREAVNKLHDLIEKTLDDMEDGKNAIKADMDVLKNYSDGALDQGDSLSDRLTNFTDSNMDQVNAVTDRIENVIDLLPNVMNQTRAAGDSMKDLNDALSRLNNDLNISGKMSSAPYNETDYRRLSMTSSVGGTLSVDNLNPDEGSVVTITVEPDNGYELNGLTVTEASGKGISTTQTAADQYTFTMPKENVLVSAVYSYIGAFLASSDEGGRITITDKDGGLVEIKAESYNGYELEGNQVQIGNQTVTLTDQKVEVNRSAYISGNKPVIVSGKFNKKANTFKVTPVSGTGGTVTAESQTAAAGDTVTVHVVTGYQYSLKSLRYENADGTARNDITTTTSTAGEYTFNMPSYDVTVKAEFQYNPDSDTVIYAESSVGGTVTAERSAASGDEYYVTMVPASGYEVPDNTCLEIYHNGNNVVAQTTLNKDAFTQNGDSYRYLLKKSDYTTPIRVWGNFVKSASARDITCTSGTGGAVTASSSSAKAGDEVYLTSVTENGYRLKKLTVKSAGGSEISYRTEAKRYTFTMPADDVEVTVEYEPIQLMITSNAGGKATYSGGNDTKVTLSVSPDSGYTVSGNPIVKNKDGGTISLGRASAGTWKYEFYLTGNEEPATAVITFQKQNQNNATQDALDRINANAGTLNGKSNDISMKIDEIQKILVDNDGNIREWSSLSSAEKTELLNDISDLMDYVSDAGTAASEILSDLALIASIEGPYISDAANAAHGDLDTATKHVQSIIDNLQNASDAARGIVDYLNGQSDLKFSKLGEDFDKNLDDLHDQLKGINDSIHNISDHASDYSDMVNDDLKAVNDQLNVVFNLFVDRAEDLENKDDATFYADVSDEEIETATTGRVDNSLNKGVVEGDINVGGIAGSMAIDEEDPEDNAAGSTDFSLGDSYKTKCIITGSTNQGFVTSKKDGAGGIAGYMKYGVITDCKALGSVESTDGDYIGGICGQSLALIRRCYALCSLTGKRNVGGIAGYGTTITDCYSMVNLTEATGRYGAIAGQIAINEDEEPEEQDETQKNPVSNNYYVGEDIYGIDNISYIGVAEPLTYEELLAVEGLPNDFWHLKVTYRVDDMYLGTEELDYGDSMADLHFPVIPAKDGCYGIWPDTSQDIMKGNIVIEGEYKDNVTVVQSEAMITVTTANGEQDKALALVEGIFTENTKLHASVSDEELPEDVAGENNYTVYKISLEESDKTEEDTMALRLWNPYEKASVWSCQNGVWKKADSKVRGQYLQTDLKGTEGMFCVVEETSGKTLIIIIAICVVAVLLLVILIKKFSAGRKNKKESSKKQKVKQKKKSKDKE